MSKETNTVDYRQGKIRRMNIPPTKVARNGRVPKFEKVILSYGRSAAPIQTRAQKPYRRCVRYQVHGMGNTRGHSVSVESTTYNQYSTAFSSF